MVAASRLAATFRSGRPGAGARHAVRGADVLDQGARPVVTIRVLTIENVTVKGRARESIIADRGCPPPPGRRTGTGAGGSAAGAGGEADGQAEAAGAAA